MERVEHERDLILFAAYGNAQLSLTDPKKFPRSFDAWLNRRPKRRKKQSGAEMFANIKAFASQKLPEDN